MDVEKVEVTDADKKAARAAQADMIVGGFQGDRDVWRKVEERFARHRLAALEASPVKELEAALEIAAHRFRTYETLHRNRGTSEGYEKAASNGDMARLCEAALNQYRGGKA